MQPSTLLSKPRITKASSQILTGSRGARPSMRVHGQSQSCFRWQPLAKTSRPETSATRMQASTTTTTMRRRKSAFSVNSRKTMGMASSLIWTRNRLCPGNPIPVDIREVHGKARKYRTATLLDHRCLRFRRTCSTRASLASLRA